jgi:CUB/sushi domain-containing protein
VCQCRGGSCQWHPPIDQRCIPVRTTCPWPTLANGIVKYGLDRSVRYTCDNGYRMKGEAIGVCKCPSTEHCHWTPQPPRCVHHTTTTCAAPKLDHGHITGSKTALYEEHRHIRFSCDSGYRLSNSSDVVCKCKKDGCYWSPSLPTCTKDHTVCPDPIPIVNGHVYKSGRKTGATALYECYYGFRLRGNGRRTCRSDGTWDGNRPVCSRESS